MPKPRLGYKESAKERNSCFTRITQKELNTDSLFIFGQYGGFNQVCHTWKGSPRPPRRESGKMRGTLIGRRGETNIKEGGWRDK